MESSHSPRFSPPNNSGLLQLIRAKRERNWKRSAADSRKGFLGWHQRGYLPHFDAPGVTQFVTFQLHDSFPAARRAEFEPVVKDSSDSKIRRKIEAWLDRGYGESWLRRPQVAGFLEHVLREKDGQDFQLQAWIIMPNHVHLVLDVWDVPLMKLINAWKGKSAREGNRLMSRSGSFWQVEYYDTLIRDEAHLKRAIRYTELNPVRAKLAKNEREWPWSSARHRDQYDRLPWHQG